MNIIPAVARMCPNRGLPIILLILVSMPAMVCADIMVMTLLGTGTPRPEAHRFGAAVLIEAGQQKVLFDAGRGVAQRLTEIYTPLKTVDKVMITHLHYDHLVGLPDLFLSGWQFGRLTPLRVWGPEGIAQHTGHLSAAYRADIDLRHLNTGRGTDGARFETTEISTEGKAESDATAMVYNNDGLVIRAFTVDHGIVHHAFGYHIEYRGYTAVISGDTRYSETLVRLAKGVDVLVHEVAASDKTLLRNNESLRRVLAYHTSVDELTDVLNKTRPRLALLTHVLTFGVSEEEVLQRVQSGYKGDLRMGQDLLAVDIGKNLRVYHRPIY